MEHSRLLKFILPEGFTYKIKMAEQKMKIEYENPKNVEAEVPGAQKIREINNENGESEVSTTDTSNQFPDTFHEEPVIKVTKNEATFTKGGLKLQKVTVTEDISVKFQHLFRKQTAPGKTVVTQIQAFEYKY